MSNFQWNSNRERKSSICEIAILNTRWKDCKSRKNFGTKKFTYTKKIYVDKIASVNLSKIYFLQKQRKHVNQTTAI